MPILAVSGYSIVEVSAPDGALEEAVRERF
jgi:hypothetical protein